MSDPLPSRTRPRGTEALGVQPGEMFEGEEFIIEGTTVPNPGAVFLFLGLFALAVAASVIVASRS